MRPWGHIPVDAKWQSRAYRGYYELTLDYLLMRGEHRPRITVHYDGSVYGNGPSGFVRKYPSLKQAVSDIHQDEE